MKEQSKIPFSQLWVEEEQYLAAVAGDLPRDSIVVEIGTAQGGSASLFANATAGKNISIFSYDISPSEEAYENLRGLGVNIIAKSSIEGAAEWKSTCDKPIDLFFIDGSHTLIDVFRDYTSWVLFLKPGGCVLFHDYDPPGRGGFPHLAVRIVVEAVLGRGVLAHIEHVGRILKGIVENPEEAVIAEHECFKVWKKLGQDVIAFRDRDYSDWQALGEKNSRNRFFCSLLGIQLLKTVPDNWEKVLIMQRPLKEEFRKNVVLLDDLTARYLLCDAIKSHYGLILDSIRNRSRLFRWQELLLMLDHSSGIPPALPSIFETSFLKSIGDLSRVIARELVRLGLLSEIIELL